MERVGVRKSSFNAKQPRNKRQEKSDGQNKNENETFEKQNSSKPDLEEEGGEQNAADLLVAHQPLADERASDQTVPDQTISNQPYLGQPDPAQSDLEQSATEQPITERGSPTDEAARPHEPENEPTEIKIPREKELEDFSRRIAKKVAKILEQEVIANVAHKVAGWVEEALTNQVLERLAEKGRNVESNSTATNERKRKRTRPDNEDTGERDPQRVCLDTNSIEIVAPSTKSNSKPTKSSRKPNENLAKETAKRPRAESATNLSGEKTCVQCGQGENTRKGKFWQCTKCDKHFHSGINCGDQRRGPKPDFVCPACRDENARKGGKPSAAASKKTEEPAGTKKKPIEISLDNFNDEEDAIADATESSTEEETEAEQGTDEE